MQVLCVEAKAKFYDILFLDDIEMNHLYLRYTVFGTHGILNEARHFVIFEIEKVSFSFSVGSFSVA